MKSLIFENANSTLKVEYVTDLISSDSNNFTVMETKGLSEAELDFGLQFQSVPQTIQGFKAFAVANNLKLSLVNSGVATVLQAISTDLAITTTTMTGATHNVAYTRTIAATGGNSPYIFSVTTGALPTGLSLNTSTGVISGTPTTAGTTNFTMTVTDQFGVTDTQVLTLVVA